MPHVNFGTKDTQGFELDVSPDLIAVRTRSLRSVRGVGPVASPSSAEVSDGNLVASFPEAGVEIYRVPTATRSLDARKRSLRTESDVRFAGSVLVQPKSGKPVLYSENIYIRFKPEIDSDDCEAVLLEVGLTIREHLAFADNAYFVSAPEGTGQRVFDIALSLLNRKDVVYCHPELLSKRQLKTIFPQQWHLKSTTINGVTVNAHANVEAAHVLTRGAGTTIAVIDDGVDTAHPEFAGASKIVSPRDATLQTDDARPKLNDEKHGTACAGVACGNGTEGASGVAPAARLMPIRLRSALGSIREADAFRWAADHGADVISCSWGPEDGAWFDPSDPLHTTPVQLPASTRDAINYAVTNGRGGKGCVVLFAAGNGNESVDLDGYASYVNVIAVAACNDRGVRSVYSDFGKAVWCSFPSSDFGDPATGRPEPLTPGIWTTDRLGTAGYNPGNLQFGDAAGKFTNDFGGTSSACPGAAGVAALVLSANPGLRWNEVKDLLRRACDRIDPSGGAYSTTGHSKNYGYGRLNAETAVKLAKQNVGRLVVVNKLLNEPIPDLGRVSGTIDSTETTPVENVLISVRLQHTYLGDLVITVIPPAASGLSKVILHNRTGGSRNNLDRQYDPSNTPGLAAYIGKKCHGTWTVQVEDKAAQDSGTLIQIGLHLSLPPAALANGEATPRETASSSPKRVSKSKAAPKKAVLKKTSKR